MRFQPARERFERTTPFRTTGGPFVGCGDAISQNDACLRVSTGELLSHGNVLTLVVEDLDLEDSALVGGTAVFPNGTSLPAAVFGNVGVARERELPRGSLQIYPSPAGERAAVQFESAGVSVATLVVRDLIGRTVLLRSLGRTSIGANRYSFDTSRLASGLYFCEITLGQASLAVPLRGSLLVAH